MFFQAGKKRLVGQDIAVVVPEAFEKVGWFIPPFISLGPLHRIAGAIYEEGANYTQANLQADLAALYEPGALAAMVVER